jgi:NAD(P)-dependent dehydrogenase (short-subunit alcohol dehydrogenase family)
MVAKQVVLILGAGPRVGGAVASKFASLDYSVALASRKGTGDIDSNGHLSLQADFSKPETVAPLFEEVRKRLGVAPSVVVYNAAALTPPPDASSVLSISQDSFVKDININTISPYTAAQEAVKGFASLSEGIKKTFIYTGNMLNTVIMPVPMVLTLGVGKSASAYWIGTADALYKEKGYR